jgi:uncharacterized protein
MWWTALIMGLAGSLHCAGMCSPLAIALTMNKPFIKSTIMYNSGRILIYTLLGSIVSTFGSFFHFDSYQKIFSILLGIVFLLSGLGIENLRIPYFRSGMNKFSVILKRSFSSIIQRRANSTTFLLGMINGLLPCGLTYMALSACLILPTSADGFLFMLFFGLGTWPVMIGFSRLLTIPKWKNGFAWKSLSKIAMALIGCILLLRVWWMPHTTTSVAKSYYQVTICK